jgi:HPt (histidine-containing phosphotransfer) domain-containing protein
VDIDGFNVAITNGDFSGAGEIVHAAKGVAGNLSLTAFFETCATLMDQLRNGGTPDAENVERFRQFFAETKVAVDEYLGVLQS